MIEERREIFFNYSKARLMIGFGLLMIVSTFILPGFVKFFGFIIGGSIIYFARKAVSSDVQLAFEGDELYIGFDSNKTYKKAKIKSIQIVRDKVDFRTMEFLRVVRYISVKGKRQTNMKEYPIDYLDIPRDELSTLIAEFLDYE